MSSIHLSMRLCKKWVEFSDLKSSFSGMKEHKSKESRLFTSQSNEDAPDWLAPLKKETGFAIGKLNTRSCGAAYALRVRYKATQYIVVYTFGTAHHRLDDELFEPRFGLRVALNSIESSDLRNIDVASLDSSTLKRRVQSSRSTPVGDFGIDVNQDLLTLLSGRSNDVTFARVITGRDAVSFTCPTTAGFFNDKAVHAIEKFKRRDYKTRYPWIDYIDTVKDSKIIDDLDKELISELTRTASGAFTDASLSVPDISDPLIEITVSYSGAGMKPGKKPTFDEISIYDYVSQVKDALSKGALSATDIRQNQKIILKEKGGTKSNSERVFRCINLEISKNRKRYVLFAGNWYEVDAKHATTIESEFQSFLTKKPIFKPTTAKNERKFIEQLDKRPRKLPRQPDTQ